MSIPSRKELHFDCPAIYRIYVEGRIDLSWSDRLEGMKIYLDTEDVDQSVTILEGELSDQAALVGLLNSLYELHTTVLSVERLET